MKRLKTQPLRALGNHRQRCSRISDFDSGTRGLALRPNAQPRPEVSDSQGHHQSPLLPSESRSQWGAASLVGPSRLTQTRIPTTYNDPDRQRSIESLFRDGVETD
jgi:hypothetical protein